MIVRPALPTEAQAYTDFAREVFIATYADSNPPALLAQHLERAFSVAQQQADLLDPARTTLVLEADDASWAGFAVLRAHPAPADVLGGNPVELERIYVGGAWHGRGAGHQLMAACIERAAANGHDVLWLGVWTENHRARRFYLKEGFIEVGMHQFDFGGELQDDVLMAYTIISR